MRKRPSLQTRRAPAPPRGARWTARLTLLLPVLAFLVAAVLYCLRLNRLLLANLSPILAAEITRQTGHETRLGRIRYSTLGVLVVENVAVSSRATFAQSHGEAVVRADRVTIHYDPRSLLFDSGNAAHALGDIVVDQPSVLVERFSKTQFNFSDILKPQPNQPQRKPFDGQVIARDATLRFRDYLAPAGLGIRPAFNELDHVGATVNLRSERTVYFTGTGQGTAGRLASFSVSGDASRLVAGRYRVAAQVSDADAAYWTDYFPFTASPQALVRAGRADVDVTVSRLGSKPPPGLPVDVLGRVAVRRAAVALTAPTFRRLSVRDLTGSVTFTGAGVAFSAAAALGGQPVAFGGTVFDFAHPQLAATATSARLDAKRLARAFPAVRWPAGLRLAPGPATVRAVGAFNGPTVSADGAFSSAEYAGNRVADVRASAVFAGRTLTLPGLTFQTPGGGRVALNGTVGTGSAPTVRLSGRARGVNLAALKLPGGDVRKLGLGGRADAQVLADNIGHPLRVVANVTVARPRVGRTALVMARARLAFTAGQGLTVSRALIRSVQGAALVSGTIPAGVRGGRWNLSVDAAGLNLAALAGPYTQAPVGGLAYFRGRVQGPAATPQAVGQVQFINPRFRRFTADVVSGALAASAGAVRLNDVVVRRFPTAAHISGTVTRLASADPQLDLGVRVSQADVQDFLSLAGAVTPPAKGVARRAAKLPPITGTAQGAFRIGGTVRAPRVAGQVGFTDGTVGPYRVDSLRLRAAYQNGAVRVADATLRGEGATVTARGTLALKTGKLQAAFAGTGIDLERFRDISDPYVDLDGIFGVSGTAGGTLKSPAVAATVTGRDVSLNGQALAPVVLAGRYAGGVFVKTGAPWTLDFLPAASAQHGIRYVVDGLRLALPTPQHPKRPAALALDAAVPADAPETVAHLIETLRASRYAVTPAGRKLLNEIDALPRPLAGTLAVPRLTVRGTLAAPAVEADLQANGLALGESRIGGVTAQTRFADPKNPAAQLSATANSLLVGGVPIADVTARAALSNHVLTLDTLRATSERAFLEASGRADLNGDMTVTLDASNFPLALLNPLLAQPDVVEQRTLTGELGSLSVTASGPTRAPNLTASINLANPGFAIGVPGKPPATEYALDRVRSGAITLTTPRPGGAQVLTVTDLAAFKNGRPIVSLSGTLPFRWGGAGGGLPEGETLHAQLVAQDLSLLAPFAPALDPKKTAGTLMAGLDVTGAGSALRLDGTVDLTGGALGAVGFDTALTKVSAHVALRDGRLVFVPRQRAVADGQDQVVPPHYSITQGQVAVAGLTGTSSQGGTFAVTGGGTLGPVGAASLRLTAKNLVLDETSGKNLLARTYSTAFRGKLNGSVDMVGPWKTPTISTPAGAPLLLTDASGTLPSAPAGTTTPAGPPKFDPALGLMVLLGGGNKTVTVTSALLRADASGDVELTGRLSDPRLTAHLAIVRGQFILPPATRLRFVRSPEGNVVSVRYPATDPQTGLPGLRTYVDLTAQASVSLSEAQLAAYRPAVSSGVEAEAAPVVGNTATTATAFNQPERYTITAHIHGVLNDPNLPIDLTSSPAGLSRQDMLVALTGAPGLSGLFGSDAQAALQAELSQALYSVGVPAILTPLENSIAQSLNLTDFDVAYSPDAPVLVTLSKQIAPRLEATYTRSFGARAPGAVNSITMPPQYTLKLGYGLTRRLQISVSTDDQRNNTAALEGVVNF
ncbi:MAG: translocation/assembly module TamB domain-containing protein [Armatimonadetes bacterium]|nr:translocation/assembly module TamB domain-containing protein [Armatimonadota bacterium]